MVGRSPEYADTNQELYDTKQLTVTDAGIPAQTDGVNGDLDNRQFVRIYNEGPSIVYVGPTGTTAAGGLKPGEPLFKKQWMEIPVMGIEVIAITATGLTSTILVTDLG